MSFLSGHCAPIFFFFFFFLETELGERLTVADEKVFLKDPRFRSVDLDMGHHQLDSPRYIHTYLADFGAEVIVGELISASLNLKLPGAYWPPMWLIISS